MLDQYIMNENSVFSNPTNLKNYGDKIRFEAILQTSNEGNRNRRIYPKEVLREGINQIMPLVKEKKWLAELDHPISQDMGRQLTVLYKEVSHVILDIGFDGDNVVGIVETLQTNNGKILKSLISDSKIPVGFSLRAIGNVEPLYEGMVKVTSPLRMICYDAVSVPSHNKAWITKITESDTLALKESFGLIPNINKPQCLCESSNSLLEGKYTERNGMICFENGVCVIPDTFDKLVEQRKVELKNKFRF